MIHLELITPKINIDFQKTRRLYYICSNKEKGIRYLCKQVGYDMLGNYKEYIEYEESGEIKEKYIYDYCEHGIASVYGKEYSTYFYSEFIYGSNNLPEREIMLSKIIFKLDAIEEIPGSPDNSHKENTLTEITEYSYDEFGRSITETKASYYPDGRSNTLNKRQNKYFDSSENAISYKSIEEDAKRFKKITLISPDNKIKIVNVFHADGRMHTSECTSYEENGSITHSYEVFGKDETVHYLSIYDPNGNLIDYTEYDDYDDSCIRKIFGYDEKTYLLKFCREIITKENEVIEDNFLEYEVVLEDRI